MKTIKFHGEKYLFGGETLQESGFIAKREDFENGIPSFAHYFPDQGVMRYGSQISTRDDIEVLGDADAEMSGSGAIENLLGHPGWRRK